MHSGLKADDGGRRCGAGPERVTEETGFRILSLLTDDPLVCHLPQLPTQRRHGGRRPGKSTRSSQTHDSPGFPLMRMGGMARCQVLVLVGQAGYNSKVMGQG